MNTISVINILPTSKQEIESFFQDAKSRILSGYEDPLKIQAQLKSFEQVIEQLRDDKDIKEVTLTAAEKEGGKTFKKYGAEFQIKEAGTKYDFTVCEDAAWDSLNIQLKNLLEIKKERETFLKSIKSEVYDNSGIQINPPVKTSQTIVSIKIL